MPTLDEVTYSRTTCIEAIRDYYHFLTKLYLDDSEILEPPAGGWPSITAETCGKNEEVVALLRALPYMPNKNDGTDAQATPWCYFHNWSEACSYVASGESDVKTNRVLTEVVGYVDDIPDHVVGLTLSQDDWGTFLLDTKLGVIYCMARLDEITSDSPLEPIRDDAYDYAAENEAEWRAEGWPWKVEDFFELLKEQYLKLRFVPSSKKGVEEYYFSTQHKQDEEISKMLVELRSIYREHGWPDLERYCKRECLNAVRAAIERRGLTWRFLR
jgi:hypothetical protein